MNTSYRDFIVANFNLDQITGLRRLVAGALAFGGLASIAANVVHSITHTRAGEPGWQVWGGAVAAALAPIIMFLAIEMVSRIPTIGRVFGWIRIGATGIVAAGSAWVSYWSIVSVAEFFGENSYGKQYLFPVIIDGMMMVATISLIELGRIKSVVVEHNQTAEAAAAKAAADADAAAAQAATVAAAKAAAAPSTERVQRMEAARKKGGYYGANRDAAWRTSWTLKWNREENEREAKEARRAARSAPTSPGRVPVDSPSIEVLEDAVR